MCDKWSKEERYLQWEQKWLAQQVKWDFTADEREELFLTWNIHKESKQRKLQLIKCLWSAKTLRLANPIKLTISLRIMWQTIKRIKKVEICISW